MAKAILEYDLNDIDDTMAHMRAVRALDMALVLWQFGYNTKKGIASEIEFKDLKDPYDVLDRVFELFWEEMNAKGINLDDLVN